jgi:hypothetical protein
MAIRGMWRNEIFIANFVSTFNLVPEVLEVSSLEPRLDFSLAYKHDTFTVLGAMYGNTHRTELKNDDFKIVSKFAFF